MAPTRRRELLQLAVLVAVVWGAQQAWVAHHRADAALAVVNAARPGDIHMISSDNCGVCDVARQWLQAHAVPFTECSIEREPACRAAFEATMAPGTPVMVVRGRPLVGFSPRAMADAL